MTEWRKKSFSEVAFVEAVARRANAYLVIRPIRRGSESRLYSRFLGIDEEGNVILAAPRTQQDGKKVFLPVGWDLGVTFPVGHLFLQTRTRVLGHCQYAQYPTRRVDAMVVERSHKVVSLNRRRSPRSSVDPSAAIAAFIWLADDLARRRPAPQARPAVARRGLLLNRSEGGLGIQLDRALSVEVGCEVIVRLEDRLAESAAICRGVLKHCTRRPDGTWLAGLGDVVEIGPGQAVPIMESLVLGG